MSMPMKIGVMSPADAIIAILGHEIKPYFIQVTQ
jgi:hypothetical protein